MHPKPRATKLSAKKNRILNLIFHDEGCSRFRLARELNINASMVGIYVKEFLDKGVLCEDHTGPTRRGRSPIPVRLNPTHGCFLGIDFESLRARGVITDFAGQPLRRKEILFPPGIPKQGVLGRLIVLGKELVRESQELPLLAVGIACPGQVDSQAGTILDYPLFDDFRDVPILDIFQPQFSAPVFVEHDIRAITLAEQLRGAGKGMRNFLCLTVRSGVDLGIVIDGRIYGGSGAMAGKLGHNVIPNGKGTRTWTEMVSVTGIVQQALDLLKGQRKSEPRMKLLKKGESLSLADVVSAAEQGDRALREMLEQVGKNLGMVAANLANLFSPEKIILTGEVPTCSPFVRHSLEAHFRKFTLPAIATQTTLADGHLTGFAGSIGAAYLGLLRIFPVEEQAGI